MTEGIVATVKKRNLDLAEQDMTSSSATASMLLLSITKPKLLGPPVRATALANSMTVALQT